MSTSEENPSARVGSLVALGGIFVLAYRVWVGYDGALLDCTWHPSALGRIQAVIGVIGVLALVACFVLLVRWADSGTRPARAVEAGSICIALAAVWVPLYLLALDHHDPVVCEN